MSSSALPDPALAPIANTVERDVRLKPGEMRFGLFGGAQAQRGAADPSGGFLDYVETCVEAEALGFTSTFLVEHHFSGTGQLSASLDLLAWVGARTSPFGHRS